MRNQMNSNRQQQRAIVGALFSLLAIACGVQWAEAQGIPTEYISAPYDAAFLVKDAETGEVKLNDKAVSQFRNVKNQVIIGSIPFAENADRFRKYYDYLFRSMTHLENLNHLPDKRKEIVDDLKRAKTKDVRDSLLNDTFSRSQKLVTAPMNLHPGVRFNAMLLIGELNADEASLQNRYPHPLPAALDFMVAEYQRTKLDGVKLAAMIGILRHVQLDPARPESNRIPAATRQQIAKLMLELVNTKTAPSGRNVEGHVWMQRRAIEILAALGYVGSNDTVNQAITGLIRDHNADLMLRLTAASSLGTIKPPAKGSIDPTKESLQMAALLVEACRKELDRMEAWQKKKAPPGMEGMMGGMGGGMMSGMMPGMAGSMMPGMGESDSGSDMGSALGMPGADGMMSGAMAGPKDPVVQLIRRQLKYEIECVRRGITGVSRLVPPTNKKPPFEDLNKEINLILTATDPPPAIATVPGLQKSLKENLKALEDRTAALLPKPKADPAPEAESDVPVDVPQAAESVGAVGSVPAAASDDPTAPARSAAVANPAVPGAAAGKAAAAAGKAAAGGVGPGGAAAVPGAPGAAAAGAKAPPPAGNPAAPAAPAAPPGP